MLDLGFLFEQDASWATDVGAVDDTFRSEWGKLKVVRTEGCFTFSTDKTGLVLLFCDVVVERLSLKTAGDTLIAELSQARAHLADVKADANERVSLLHTELDKSDRKVELAEINTIFAGVEAYDANTAERVRTYLERAEGRAGAGDFKGELVQMKAE